MIWKEAFDAEIEELLNVYVLVNLDKDSERKNISSITALDNGKKNWTVELEFIFEVLG